MKTYSIKTWLFCAVAGLACGALAETHSQLQAVNSDGGSTWEGEFPFTIRGVITTPPEEMLDPTPNFIPWAGGAHSGQMGAEWQIALQATDPGDQGGTLLWLGQCYGNQPWIHDEALSYTNEEWLAELARVSTDPDSGHVFQPGDQVEVTVRQALSYGGKRNINEAHSNDPAKNFDIRLIQAGYGLPSPEVITLSDLTLPAEEGLTEQVDLFDMTRQSGGERYQGVRVQVKGLRIVHAEGWDPEGTWSQRRNIQVTDGENRFFTIRYPRRDLGPVPTGVFDAIGIINQESGSSSQGTTGYELFLQEVITEAEGPQLSLSAKGMLQWSADCGEGWILEKATVLTGEWSAVEETPTRVGDFYTLQIDLSTNQGFYRLRKE